MLDPEEAKRRQCERVRLWKLRNPEKCKAHKQSHYERHPEMAETQRKQIRQWQIDNPDARKDHNKTHYQKHRDKYLAKAKANYVPTGRKRGRPKKETT